MAVKIRLRRMGSKGKPFYRVVVADSRSPRDGRSVDILGYYDPRTEPATIKIDEEKALLWLNRGAQPTDTAEALLKKQSIFQKYQAAKSSTAPAVEAEPTAQADVEAKAAPTRKRRTKAAETEAVEEPEQVAAPEAAVESETTTEEQLS